MDTQILSEDIERMRHCASYGKRYKTYVEIDLHEVVTSSEEDFLETISLRATDTPVMEDIAWAVVDYKNADTIILQVLGDVTECVKLIDEYRGIYT
jgi:transcriptional regulator NrdR family protein